MVDGVHKTYFDNDLLQLLKTEELPHHSNGMRFTAYDQLGQVLDTYVYYSIGGGFVRTVDEMASPNSATGRPSPLYPYHTCEELRDLCNKHSMNIAELQMQNEISFGKTAKQVSESLLNIWSVMNQVIETGLHSPEKLLPGNLNVRRRAPEMFARLESMELAERQKIRTVEGAKVHELGGNIKPIGTAMDWLSVYAMAVNEENAAGGRVVTSPTNGAAGVIPAVLRYYIKWGSNQQSSPTDIVNFLITAGVIGLLFKKGASISAAEVGCQGEIGVACSMAAAGLTAVYGGSPAQIENAAEIGMEHHLGLTCDPIGGLVQIPCIERNTMGSIKAVNASHLALLGDGNNVVPLDTIIATMLKTGRDMQTKYKETSLGGLAIHSGVTEC
jgi:L-serine dehydratase